MKIQDFINKVKNWYYRADIAKFDQDYAKMTEGEQFPSEKEISKQLDLALKRFDGNKISTDFSSNDYKNLEMSGVNDNTD